MVVGGCSWEKWGATETWLLKIELVKARRASRSSSSSTSTKHKIAQVLSRGAREAKQAKGADKRRRRRRGPNINDPSTLHTTQTFQYSIIMNNGNWVV